VKSYYSHWCWALLVGLAWACSDGSDSTSNGVAGYQAHTGGSASVDILTGGTPAVDAMTDATTSITAGNEAGSSTLIDAATTDGASATSGNNASGAGGIGGSSEGGSSGSSEGGSSGSSESGSGGSNTGACQDAVETEWATSCPTSQNCTSGAWQAPPQGSDGHPFRDESEHFAIYWYDSDPDGSGPLLGVNTPPSASTIDNAFTTLESIWDVYFGDPIYFPEPYCDSSTKWKAAVHIDDYYPLWGGGWGGDKMGLWIREASLSDNWGLAHELTHGVQSTTQAFPDCGGIACWIFESHANWMPHQVYRDNAHCSELLVNAPHLYYGNTRNRYCNWQFLEFIKDKYCYTAVNDMWAFVAPNGQRDPWQKLMLSRGWDIERLNDEFGEWAMHNITWDYKNPPPTDGSDQGIQYSASYGSMIDSGNHPERSNRMTRLESLDSEWQQNRRFVSPYYWAPQRWGYNIVRLFPDPGATEVQVTFRGVTQSGANSGWRWGLVATDSNVTRSRYSELQRGADGSLRFCIESGEQLFLVVTATPTEYIKIPWTNPADGPAYPSLYRYPYIVQLSSAWPQGFEDGQIGPCPSGTARHSNGGGCATPGTAASVYVGPYASVIGGTVSGDARIEDQATIARGTVSGGVIGALSIIGTNNRGFNISGSPTVRTTFLPLGWFGGTSVSGSATVVGDVEFNASVSSGFHYGLVDGTTRSPVSEVTTPPPYSWRP
jgi:hypothetical protein